MKNVYKYLIVFFLFFFLCACNKREEEAIIDDPDINEEEVIEEDPAEEEPVEEEPVEIPVVYHIDAVNDGDVIFYTEDGYYRYGPSIMVNEDGTMDAWFASPGNSSTQWDWITYRHYEDGEWSNEKTVLRPTEGSKDRCSVCDPGVIYFGGYYYLAYTATDYYDGNGSYNMAFVARSRNPDGPFEKWNGKGWGGKPEPIIFYDGGKDNWGIGEVSFVIRDDDLFIYYTYIDVRDTYIGLSKADLTEDWPLTIRDKGPVLYQSNHDSLEVVYDSNLDTFLAFTIDERLTESAKLFVYASPNGKIFELLCETEDMVEDFAHNLGVAKSKEGALDSSGNILIGYAYGKDWGRWDTKLQDFRLWKEGGE